MFPIMAQAQAPTPTLPRKRGRETAAPPPQPSPARGGGLGGGKRRKKAASAGVSTRPVRHSQPIRPDQLTDRVLYHDGLVLVIDKPAGIPVHQGPGGGPHLEHWFPLLRFGLP